MWQAWQVHYNRYWHSWYKLNLSAEQIIPSGTLGLPLSVSIADIFRARFTQQKKEHPSHLFSRRHNHLYVRLLVTHPLKDLRRVFLLWRKPCPSLEQRIWVNGHTDRTCSPHSNVLHSSKLLDPLHLLQISSLLWQNQDRALSQPSELPYVLPRFSVPLTLITKLQCD